MGFLLSTAGDREHHTRLNIQGIVDIVVITNLLHSGPVADGNRADTNEQASLQQAFLVVCIQLVR